ncbi:39S ribosomal protein L44, mitochondrial [Bagarius yarrelli]|uniref:Large ribosomal subunit protein mL44 n=1 Tax=Bagarius yarrelli TaxID=175774 RepID=A0A556V777_BAGYA|nr:39S ribosomal protein L44, mitochondrial [Bagarius yarrelli]
MAACRTLVSRGVLTLGLHYQHVCRSVLVIQTREKKRWMKAYTLLMERKRRLEGPPPPIPRSQKPNWDYHTEVEAFSARLKERFSTDLLKTAFVNRCYVLSEEERRRSLGLDAVSTALNLTDNTELQEHGRDFTLGFLTDWCRGSFPSLPEDGVVAIVSHLTGSAVMCHVARDLAVEELAMTAEFPVPDDVLQATFFAVIGALEQSSGSDRAGLFIRDFLVTQLIGKDLFDMWKVVNPMGVLVEELRRRGASPPEPRLLQSSGASTVLPLHFVGLYCDKKLLAHGPGETLSAAEDEAARVALRKLFGYTENRKPFDFSPKPEPETSVQKQAISSR